MQKLTKWGKSKKLLDEGDRNNSLLLLLRCLRRATPIALFRKLVLLTPNHRHFSKIPRLLIEDWTV
ncbi:hypothetical protein [Nostoc sp.]|uniref:hypothetical protein n=1 Tax=Nostoc sp. TaxID=1180 RepID=UPI0035937CB4